MKTRKTYFRATEPNNDKYVEAFIVVVPWNKRNQLAEDLAQFGFEEFKPSQKIRRASRVHKK